MRPSRKFTVRIFAYSAVLLYLAIDLVWLKGPLSQHIRRSLPGSPESLQKAKEQGVVARVFGKPIYQSQVERALLEHLWLEGRTLADLPVEKRRDARMAALNDLIDHELLRTKVQANQNDLPVSAAEIDEAIRRLATRFAHRDEMQRELAAEGIDSEKELRFRLAARIQQQKYIESRIAPETEVTAEEARDWYQSHRDELALPVRVHARHLFLATLGKEASKVKARLESAISDLNAGKQSFENLAASLSEDPRTAPRGGDLGWLTAERLPADFAAPVFQLPLHQPKLIRTSLGWHYVEVLEKRPRETRPFEEARAEIIAALRSAKRDERVRALRTAIRNTERIAIHVYPEMIPTG
ncbi:parvulin-like peptidyl-prolyl isomerase [Haloferula luteola]|uniref:Parvulin-like peptidyl-prolyl isomerase n=1 Tax=Haloferula luteola TaxID=595692 RepID=A0A840UVN2_9BACT|nr:peptidylprolyl isomerase [Haloferula luteola]MBB5350247.1 parvulin-like peptidyl-prolyl isomerase [Haloferula luteola]